jgi:hypothetical protein
MGNLADLTVLITTSPVPSNPSTEMISRGLKSLDRFLGTGYSVMVVCDGSRGSDEGKERYDEFKQRLRRLVPDNFHEVHERVHQAGTVRKFLDHVRTKYVLLWEHDWEVVRPVECERILDVLGEHDEVKFVRLNGRANKVEGWDTILR